MSKGVKSDLDLSFAKVDLEDARLLLSKAQNDLDAAFAQLSNLLGLRESRAYHLVKEPIPPGSRDSTWPTSSSRP